MWNAFTDPQSVDGLNWAVRAQPPAQRSDMVLCRLLPDAELLGAGRDQAGTPVDVEGLELLAGGLIGKWMLAVRTRGLKDRATRQRGWTGRRSTRGRLSGRAAQPSRVSSLSSGRHASVSTRSAPATT